MHSNYKPSTAPQRPHASYNPPSHAYKPTHQKNASASSSKNPNSVNSSAQKLQQNSRPNGIVEPQRRELLVMTIDLGNGAKDLLRVFEGEDPFQLAMDFCEKHKLDSKLVEPLAQNIYGNMEQVLEESVETLNLCGPNSQRKEKVNDPNGITPDTVSSRRYRTDEQVFPETTTSREFTDEEGVYQMLNHADNMEAPIIAERVGMMDPKSFDSPVKNGGFRQDMRNSGNKGSPIYERIQGNNEERQVKSALIGNSGNEKKIAYSNSPYGQEVRRSSGPTVEFRNEPYEQYDSNPGGYELTLTPNNSQNNPELYAKFGRPANVQTSDLKQEQTLNKSTSSTLHNSSAPLINYGTLLYHRGLQKNEEVKKQLAEQRKKKLEIGQKECTFKPELNPLSQQIVSTKARMENVPEMLINAGKNKQEKLERVRSAHKAKQLEECTFKPETNIISHKIDQQKSQMSINVDQDRCLRLFQEAKGRRDQREYISNQLSPDYTFKPSTIQYKEGAVAQTTFEERDRKFKERLERVNHMRQMKEEAEVFDPETGEELFKPKVGRAPQGRNSGNLPIGDYLYNQHLKAAEDKKRQTAYHQRSVESSMMVKSNDKSHAMVENRMRRRLEDVFKRLDSDGDGVISSSKIDITRVEIEILETLAPILCDMEENNQALDFETFYELTEKLLRFISVPEKDQLLLGKRGPVAEPQYTFQPAIDPKSEKLAQKKHPYGHFSSLYSSYTDERQKLQQKLQNEKDKKIQDELKECSFKPKLYTKGASGTKSAKNSAGLGKNYFMDDLLL